MILFRVAMTNSMRNYYYTAHSKYVNILNKFQVFQYPQSKIAARIDLNFRIWTFCVHVLKRY